MTHFPDAEGLRLPDAGDPLPSSLSGLQAEIRELVRTRNAVEMRLEVLFEALTQELGLAARRSDRVRHVGTETRQASAGLTKTEIILRAMPGTQTQIVERTGVDRATVSALVARLRREQRVTVVGDEPLRGSSGRRVHVYAQVNSELPGQ